MKSAFDWQSDRTIRRVYSPLPFDLCLKVMCSILQRKNFEIRCDTLIPQTVCGTGTAQCRRLAILVAWRTSSCEVHSNEDGGLLLPFCLFVADNGACSTVATVSRSTRVTIATELIALRATSYALDRQMNEIFVQLSTHGSVYEAVKKGGGIYRGIQYGSPERRTPDLVLFDDPITSTTLALAWDGSPVSPKSVRSKITNSRKVFHEGTTGTVRAQ